MSNTWLTPEEERNLTAKGLAGDHEARNRVVMNMYPWICNRAKIYDHGQIPKEELIAHAVFKCIEKFHLIDLDAAKPITYLATVAERQMQMLCKTDGVIRRQQGHRHCSEETKRKNRAEVKSLNFASEHSASNLEMFLIDPRTPAPDVGAITQEEQGRFDDWMRQLPNRYEAVVRMHLIEEKTFREIGDFFSITKTRAIQIYRSALKKLEKLMQEWQPCALPHDTRPRPYTQWQQWEIEFVKREGEHKSAKMISQELNRSECSTHLIVQENKVEGPWHKQVWTDDEDDFIRANRDKGWRWCARMLHRTEAATATRAKRLGIRKPILREEGIAALKEMHAQGMSNKRISVRLGISRECVRRHITRLGLKHNRPERRKVVA